MNNDNKDNIDDKRKIDRPFIRRDERLPEQRVARYPSRYAQPLYRHNDRYNDRYNDRHNDRHNDRYANQFQYNDHYANPYNSQYQGQFNNQMPVQYNPQYNPQFNDRFVQAPIGGYIPVERYQRFNDRAPAGGIYVDPRRNMNFYAPAETTRSVFARRQSDEGYSKERGYVRRDGRFEARRFETRRFEKRRIEVVPTKEELDEQLASYMRGEKVE